MTKGKPKSEKRHRTCLIGLRVTSVEKKLIEDDAAAYGLTVQSYLRQLACDAPVPRQRKAVSVNIKALEKARADLNRSGNVLNQLTRLSHQGFIPFIPELKQALRSWIECNDKLIEAVGKRPKRTAAEKIKSSLLDSPVS